MEDRMKVGFKSQDLSFVPDNELMSVTAANGLLLNLIKGILAAEILERSAQAYVDLCKLAAENPHGIPQSYRR